MRLRRRSVRDQHVRDHEVLDEHHGPQDDSAEIDRTNEGVAQRADAGPGGGGQPTAWAGNRRRGTHSNNRFADVEGSTKFKIGQRTVPSTVWLFDFLGLVRRAGEQVLDGPQETAWGEGLFEKLPRNVTPCAESRDEEDGRGALATPERSRQGEPIDVRHAHVRHHRRDLSSGHTEERQRFPSISSLEHAVAFPEHVGHQATQQRLVVDDENERPGSVGPGIEREAHAATYRG